MTSSPQSELQAQRQLAFAKSFASLMQSSGFPPERHDTGYPDATGSVLTPWARVEGYRISTISKTGAALPGDRDCVVTPEGEIISVKQVEAYVKNSPKADIGRRQAPLPAYGLVEGMRLIAESKGLHLQTPISAPDVPNYGPDDAAKKSATTRATAAPTSNRGLAESLATEQRQSAAREAHERQKSRQNWHKMDGLISEFISLAQQRNLKKHGLLRKHWKFDNGGAFGYHVSVTPGGVWSFSETFDGTRVVNRVYGSSAGGPDAATSDPEHVATLKRILMGILRS